MSGRLAESLKFFALKGFPGIDLNCVFVPVRSTGRRCEYRAVGTTLFVVVDIELSDRLMELDLLAQIPRSNSDWICTFSTALPGDVFRQQRDLERYRYCVLKASGDRETFKDSARIAKGWSSGARGHLTGAAARGRPTSCFKRAIHSFKQ